MKTNILAIAIALPGRDLLARTVTLARNEREAAAELVVHLTALELRPSLYAAEGYGSLFDYCTRALGLSEDAACSRIKVVRACMRFPVVLDHLLSGALTLTSARLLAPHLTPENHEAVLAKASHKGRGEIEALVAELAPRPDVPASVRRLPGRKAVDTPMGTDAASDPWLATLTDRPSAVPNVPSAVPAVRTDPSPDVSVPVATPDEDRGRDEQFRLQAPNSRPVVEALAPQRYRVQFTIGHQAHDDLRTVQALLRREIPSGDPGAIFTRALALLRKEVEKTKLGVAAKPRRTSDTRPEGRTYENRIRFRTDNDGKGNSDEKGNAGSIGDGSERKAASMRHERAPSRHIPDAVKRVVWYRDRGQCAFVSASGRGCVERSFLELHHIQPYALEGPATVANISLRCRRHNQYEAELIFGPDGDSVAREGRGRHEAERLKDQSTGKGTAPMASRVPVQPSYQRRDAGSK